MPWTEAAIGAADVVVITTAQSPIDYRALLAWSRCVVDTRNAIRARLGAELPAEHAAKLWQA